MITFIAAIITLQSSNFFQNVDFKDGWKYWSQPDASLAKASIVPTDRTGPGVAARYEIAGKPGANFWDIELAQQLSPAFKKGEPLVLKFWGRSPSKSKVSGFFQFAQPPYPDSFRESITLTTQWKQYEVGGQADRDMAAGTAKGGLHLNYGPGVVEIGGLSLQPDKSFGKPQSILANGSFANRSVEGWAPTGTEPLGSVPIPTGSAPAEVGKYALRAKFVSKPADNPWSVSLHAATTGSIKGGHTVYVRAWMRSPESANVSLIVERASEPFNKFFNLPIKLTPTWKEYRIAGLADQNYAPGEAQLTVFLGYGSGTVEMANVRAEDIGVVAPRSLPITMDYYQSPPSDAWKPAALARIERYRKGDLTVQVVNAQGKPVEGATVQVNQIAQEFRFGTAVPAALIADRGETGTKFREVLGRLFNTVTFENDLKWFQLTPRDYTDVDTAYKWLDANQFRVRGHNLAWGSYGNLPKGIKEMSNEQIVETLRARVKEMVTRFKGRVYLWDVVNEAVTEHELWDRIGWDKFVDMFKWAHEIDPNLQLCYNDFNWTEEAQVGSKHRLAAIEKVKELLKAGAPLDVIGIQAHVGPPITHIDRVIEIMQDLAKLGKPLEITEYDLGAMDDKVHGEHMGDFLTAMYSIPEVQSFVMWGFWNGAHWRANEGGAMFNQDWSPRPAAKVWEDLVKRQWWTKAALTTSKSGVAKTRAFFGKLRVTVTQNGKTKTQEVSVLANKPANVLIKF